MPVSTKGPKRAVKPPPVDTDKIIRGLLRDGKCARVETKHTNRVVWAWLFPSHSHPIVKARRDAFIAARSGSISLAEASDMEAKTVAAVARGSGKTLAEALGALVYEQAPC